MQDGTICTRTRLIQVHVKAFLTNAEPFAHRDAEVFVVNMQIWAERNRKEPIPCAITAR
jgi:hypothetical protein